jgi:hypothetical protein
MFILACTAAHKVGDLIPGVVYRGGGKKVKRAAGKTAPSNIIAAAAISAACISCFVLQRELLPIKCVISFSSSGHKASLKNPSQHFLLESLRLVFVPMRDALLDIRGRIDKIQTKKITNSHVITGVCLFFSVKAQQFLIKGVKYFNNCSRSLSDDNPEHVAHTHKSAGGAHSVLTSERSALRNSLLFPVLAFAFEVCTSPP